MAAAGGAGPVAAAAAALEKCLESYAAAVSDANEVDLSLALFKEQWTKAGLSKLHYSCPAGRDKADFLQCLFAATLGAPATRAPTAQLRAFIRAPHAPIPAPRADTPCAARAVYISDTYEIYKRVGCLFMLYCLHGSQPRQPPLPIRVVQSLWEPLVALRQDVRRQSTDGFAVLRLMHEQGSLEYCDVATTGLGVSIADAAALQAGRQHADIRAIRRKPLDMAAAVDVEALTVGMAAYRDVKSDAGKLQQPLAGGGLTTGGAAVRMLSQLAYADMQWDTRIAKIISDHDVKLKAGPPPPAPPQRAAAGRGAVAAGGRGRKRAAAPAPPPAAAFAPPSQRMRSVADEDEEFADMSSLLSSEPT